MVIRDMVELVAGEVVGLVGVLHELRYEDFYVVGLFFFLLNR